MSLEKLKKTVEDHLRRELGIFEEVLKLSEEDTETFYNWYINHKYVKGIEEVVEIVGRGSDSEAEGSWVAKRRIRCKKESD